MQCAGEGGGGGINGGRREDPLCRTAGAVRLARSLGSEIQFFPLLLATMEKDVAQSRKEKEKDAAHLHRKS